MRSRALAGALAAVLLAAGTACGGGSPGDGRIGIRFAWWGSEERAKTTGEAVALFMKKNPGITVKTTTAEYDPYWQKMATETAAGNAPDVMQMSDRHIREYAERGAVLDLQPYTGKAIRTADLKKEVMGLGTLDGKLYGLPLGQTSPTLVYDPVLWEKAGAKAPELGWTWDDFHTAAKKVTDYTAKSGKTVYGTSDFGEWESWFKIWLSQQGKSLYTADGKLGYTEQDVTAWWELATRFRKDGAATPAAETAANPAGNPVDRGVSASGFTPDSTIGPKAWEKYDNDFALAPFPQVGADLGLYAEPPMLISVYSRTEQRDAALKLADFIVNDPDAARILGTARGLPANLKNRELISGGLQGAARQVHAYEELIAAKVKLGPPAPPKGASSLFDLFPKYYQEVMNDKATPADAAARYMAEARQIMAG